MKGEIEAPRNRTPILRKAAAGLVLIVAGVFALYLVIHLFIAVFYIVAIVAVVAAILWALKTILW